MLKLSIFKTTSAGIEAFQKWGHILTTTRKHEALSSLHKENVLFEGMYWCKSKVEIIVVGIMVSDRQFAPPDLQMPINQEHRKLKQKYLQPISNLESVTGFENLSPLYELQPGA